VTVNHNNESIRFFFFVRSGDGVKKTRFLSVTRRPKTGHFTGFLWVSNCRYTARKNQTSKFLIIVFARTESS
jgi:hypothetical protein